MAAWKTLQRRFALGSIIVLHAAACGSGEISSTTFTIESFCTLSPRLAIVVDVSAPDFSDIESVTATHELERPCYLERVRRTSDDDAEDAGVPDFAQYSCLAQGEGTYTVRVTSAKRTWTQSVEVSGDQCHVTQLQTLTFDLD